MKRITALLLIFSMLLSFTGCYVEFNTEDLKNYAESEISSAVSGAWEDAKQEASEAVNEAASEAGEKMEEAADKAGDYAEDAGNIVQELNKELDNRLGYYRITYLTTGGMDGPDEQLFREGRHPEIDKKIPTRDGYHFLGWTRLEGSNEPQFYPGEKTIFSFTQDTTLYACWEAYNPADPFSPGVHVGKTVNIFDGEELISVWHKYEMIKENKGKIIRIRCEYCGFELMDRDLTLDEFVSIVTNGENKSFASLKKSKQKEYKKCHILYCTQDFAPAAITLIGSFYKTFSAEVQKFETDPSNFSSTKNYDDAMAQFQDFFDTLEDAAEFDELYAKSKYANTEVTLKFTHYDHMVNGETVAYALNKMRTDDISQPAREFANEFFGDLAKGSKYASAAIGIGRSIYYGYDAFASDEMVTTKTVSMVKAIHGFVALCPYVGDYYDQLLSTLEEGLELYDECHKYKNSFYEFLNAILADTTDIGGTVLTLDDVDQARIGNFDKGPTVMEVLGSMANRKDANGLPVMYSKNEKTLIVWYLTMRLEHDFENEYHITLEEYMEYMK